jgi:hypothetical protein
MTRDPDLVLRAQRAAAALERAWCRWRLAHGLGADPLPPVSSYVGYSLEEPWGQPRVVFGVDAQEAEQLAALLEGNDLAGAGAGAGHVPAQGQASQAPRPVPGEQPPMLADAASQDPAAAAEAPVFRETQLARQARPLPAACAPPGPSAGAFRPGPELVSYRYEGPAQRER